MFCLLRFSSIFESTVYINIKSLGMVSVGVSEICFKLILLQKLLFMSRKLLQKLLYKAPWSVHTWVLIHVL